MIIEEHVVPAIKEKVRLSDYALLAFKEIIPSRKGIKKALFKQRILINDRIGFSGDWVKAGMKISLCKDKHIPSKAYEKKLDVLYEDEHLAVLVKPAGIVASGNQFKTVQNSLDYNLSKSTLKDALAFPQLLHRLDAPTSGCLLAAKTKSAQVNLQEQFVKRTIEKTYLALVVGRTPHKGKILLKINHQEATSHFKTVQAFFSLSYQKISLLELKPITGRTHQLRLHCAAMGHPIIGDKSYNKVVPLLKGKGLFLHSNKISFIHPSSSKRIQIYSETPKKFHSYAEREEKRFRNFNI